MMNLKKRRVKFLDLEESQAKKFKSAFERVLSSGRFILDKEVETFERKFASFLGIKYCIGVGNGQQALQISLMALGIGEGDEVITTPISAVATTLAILATCAKPIFVDTKANGLINPDLIIKAITKKTKAILPVHLYGNPVEVDKIQTICKKYKLILIEDAAQAHGSEYKRKKLGTFGKLGCFSFYPTKNLGAFGDGGAIVTNSKKLAEICRQIRDYGQKGRYIHVRYGLNSRLDELHAAALRIKLENLDRENIKRQKIAKRYIKKLSLLKEIEIINPNHITQSNFHLFVVKTNKRKSLMQYLKKHGVDSLIHYPYIIPDQPFLKKEYGKLSFPVARKFVNTCLSLPCNPKMSLKDVNYVCLKLLEYNFSKEN